MLWSHPCLKSMNVPPDRLNLLMKKFKRNDNEEKRVAGIGVEEEGELDKGLRDIVELFNDSGKILKEENAAKKQKLERRLRKQNYV